MKKSILLIVFIALFTNCSKDENSEPEPIIYTTIVGNTYSAKSNKTYNGREAYLIYKMNTDGTISQKIRLDNLTGEIYQSMTGSYIYNHPSLELTIQHSIDVCPNCYNYFTATVNNDFKSFSYTIFDLYTGNSIDLLFKIVE